MPPSIRRVLVSGCVAAAAFAGPAAAVTWNLPASDISALGQQAILPSVAMASGGTTTVAWPATGIADISAQVATRLAGSTAFGSAQQVADVPLPGDMYPVSVGVAGDGATTLAWARDDGTNVVVQAATRPAGAATYGPAQEIGAAGPSYGGGVYSMDLAVAPDGSASIVWRHDDVVGFNVRAATRPAGSAVFGAPEDLPYSPTPGTDSDKPQVVAAPDGTFTAAWARDGVIQVATRRPGATSYGDPGNLTVIPPAGSGAAAPQVAAAPDGAITAVWGLNYGTDSVVQAATRAAGAGTFGAPVNLSAAAPMGAVLLVPQVAIGSDGTAVATWVRTNGIARVIQAATRPVGASTFGSPINLSAEGPAGVNSNRPQVAVAPDGATTVAWHYDDGADSTIRAASRLAGDATFGAPERLSASPSYDPAIAVAPDGATTVAWSISIGASSVIQAMTSSATTYALSTTRDGDGTGTITSSPAGIDCGATCRATLPLSTAVTLTATPAAGSSFAGWGGACSGTDPTCRLTLLGNRSATATFRKGTLTATVLPSRARMVSGQVLRIGIRARNNGATTATSATSCLKLPSNVVIVRAPGALRSGRTVCFRIKAIAAGATTTRVVTARAATTRKVKRYIAGSVRAAGMARAQATRKAVVISPRDPSTSVTG